MSFQQTFEQKRVEHREELQRKEDEMRQTFVLRVKEKETELKEVEKEVDMTDSTQITPYFYSIDSSSYFNSCSNYYNLCCSKFHIIFTAHRFIF